jgi:hypothetical protein
MDVGGHHVFNSANDDLEVDLVTVLVSEEERDSTRIRVAWRDFLITSQMCEEQSCFRRLRGCRACDGEEREYAQEYDEEPIHCERLSRLMRQSDAPCPSGLSGASPPAPPHADCSAWRCRVELNQRKCNASDSQERGGSQRTRYLDGALFVDGGSLT